MEDYSAPKPNWQPVCPHRLCMQTERLPAVTALRLARPWM